MHSPQAVAERLLALFAVSSKAVNPSTDLTAWVERNDVGQHFSEAERAFFYSSQAAERQALVNFSWRSEALVALVWALGGLQEMPSLSEQAKLSELPLVREAYSNPEAFIRQATLRAEEQLVEMEDHLYQQHWRVRDAQLFGKQMPPELNPGVVYERRYAMSWLVGDEEDWDDVPTDT